MESGSPELTLPQQLWEPDPRGPMVGWLRLEEAQRDQKCKLEEQQHTGASETVQKHTAPGEKLLQPHRSVCNSIENEKVNYYCFSGRAGCGLFLRNLGVIYFSFS